MKHMLLIFALVIGASLGSAASAAECYADYKAKKNNPLKLHYGVVQLNHGCSVQQAKSEVAARIGRDGWILLNVLSVFDASQLAGKEANAGPFYLRY